MYQKETPESHLPKERMERDIEKVTDRAYFASLLRRAADAVEAGEPLRIQVAGHRFTVPSDATLAVAHEVADGEHELELQFSWHD